MTNSNGNSRTLTAVRPDIFQIFLQDEDGQNILSIDDGALRQSLRIDLVNTSGRNIEFQTVDNQPTLENYHFCISFRPGTLLLTQDEDKRITLKETDEGWQMQQQDNVFYLLLTMLTSSERKVIENGERITLTLENIGAAPEGGSRGTRVEIKYNQLQYQGSNETISGNRLQYLNIVNQRGKKQIPLYVGFLGSNTILNDGTENELTLTIQALPSLNVPLKIESFSSEDISDTSNSKEETRGEGNIIKFIAEKIPDYKNNESIKQLPESLLNLLLTQDRKISFDDFKNAISRLEPEEERKTAEILISLIGSLGIVSQDDLKNIVLKFSEIGLELTDDTLNLLQVIKSEFNQDGSLEFKGLDSESTLDNAAKFTISFDVATIDNDSKHWALVEKTDADDIHIIIEHGQDHWVFGGKEEQGITPRWSFLCKQGWSVEKRDREEILRLKISNLKTQLLSGYANLYVHYENIPGYWDGYITVPVHKGPLVYRETTSGNNKVGCVGIGTDEPQAKLHVKSSNGIDGLKVDGNTAIAGNLSVTNGQVGIEMTSPSAPLQVQATDQTSPEQNSLYIYNPINKANQNAILSLRVAGKDGGNPFLSWDIKNEAGWSMGIDNRDKNKLKIARTWESLTHKTAMTLAHKNGNVGIGTDPDGNKLKVEGNTAIIGELSVTNGTASLFGSAMIGRLTNTGGTNNPFKIKQNGELAIRIEKTDTGDYWNIGQSPSKNFAFDFNNQRKSYIDKKDGNYKIFSDRRLKKDIEDLNGVLDRVLKLRPVSYRYKSTSPDAPPSIGFIAQEVGILFPDLVTKNVVEKSAVENYSLAYDEFAVLAIAAIQEQQQEINALRVDVAQLQRENQHLKQELKW